MPPAMEGIRRTDGHILRRNIRMSLDSKSPYDPRFGSPEENTFEVREGNGAMIGMLTFQKLLFKRAVADTPWGRMEIARPSLLGPSEVILGAIPVAEYSPSMWGTRVRVSLARGEAMVFRVKPSTMVQVCEKGAGGIKISREGVYGLADIRQDDPLRRETQRELDREIDEARADYKRRKKAKALGPDELKSIQTSSYTQWRIVLPKEFDGRDDILSTLVFLTSFRALEAEIPPSYG